MGTLAGLLEGLKGQPHRGIAQRGRGAGFEPLPRTLPATPCLSFWSDLFFRCHSILHLPPAPCTSSTFHQVRGMNCDNFFFSIVSIVSHSGWRAAAWPPRTLLAFTTWDSCLSTPACFRQPVVCVLICSPPQVPGGAHHRMPRGWGSPGSGAQGETSVLTDLLSAS